MSHDDDTCPHLVVLGRLEAENARLKAEVERLTLENNQYEEHHKYGQNVITSLREEVERLTKAGDAMAKTIGENGVHDNGSFLDVADSIDAWYKANGVVS